MNFESNVVSLLWDTSVRPVGLALFAWILLRSFRVRHPASQHAVWTAVLAGMLLVPIASTLALRLNLPLLPAPAVEVAPFELPVAADEFPGAALELAGPGRSAPPPSPSARPEAAAAGVNPGVLLLGLYVAGVLTMGVYFFAGSLALRRIVGRSRRLPVGPLRESGEVTIPVAAGWWNPRVILPKDWRSWNRDTRHAVLAHEFAHVRRKDSLAAALGRLTRVVLWFHPLSWWLSREISRLSELACDAAVVEQGYDPLRYSRVLLHFAGRLSRARFRVVLPGMAMASASGLSQRVDQLFLAPGNLRRIARPWTMLGFLGVPALCLAATVSVTRPLPQAPVAAVPAVVPSPAALLPIEVVQPIPPRAPKTVPLPALFAQAQVQTKGTQPAPAQSATTPAPAAAAPSVTGLRQLMIFHRLGNVVTSIGEPSYDDQPGFSPDGKRLSVSGRGDIFVIQIDTGVRTRVTNNPATEMAPVWSPDGSRIAYTSQRDGAFGIYQTTIGSGAEELIYRQEAQLTITQWSADGRFICFFSGNALYVLPLGGDRRPVELLRTGAFLYGGRISPDGRLYAYISSESGRTEVYVRPFNSTTGQLAGDARRVSDQGARLAFWGPDSKEIYFQAGGSVMVADIATSPALSTGTPKLVFQPREMLSVRSVALGGGTAGVGNVSADAQHFVFSILLQ